MKKSYLILGLLALISLIVLYFVKQSVIKKESNGFKRIFKNKELKLENVIELKNGSYSFLRAYDKDFYFYNYGEQANLYQIDYQLSYIDTLKIKLPTTLQNKTDRIQKDIFNGHVFGINAYGDMVEINADKTKYRKLNGLQVDRLKIISNQSMLARTIRSKNGRGKRGFAKLTFLDSSKIHIDKEYALPDRAENYFSNDGFFYYDNNNKNILYLYYYFGEFISLDSNLNLLYTSKTIDTVRHPKILTRPYEFGGRHDKKNKPITFATPPDYANIYLTTWKDNIYVISKLRADNEPIEVSQTKQVIDVYSIKNGAYRYSFYVPKYQGLKLRQILLKENLLVSIFKSYMVTYSFSQPL